jgi:uncharacterized protein (TIRG00374 family)
LTTIDPPKNNKKSPWLLIVSIALAIVFLYLSLRGLDWKEFGRVITSGQYIYIFPIILINSANFFFRSQRWRVLLQTNKAIDRLSVFWATMIGYLGNAWFPARAGELMRSVALGNRTGISASFILATALVERIIDVVALIIVGAISLWLAKVLPAGFQNGIILIAAVAAGGLIFLFVLPSLEARIQSIIRRVLPNEKWNRKLFDLLARFIEGFAVLRDLRRMTLFVLLTAGIWLVDGFVATILALVIHQSLSLAQAMVLLAALGLSSAIPSTPGYVGVYQFVAVAVLVPFAYSQSEALAYILVFQIINYLTVSLWGLAGFWRMRVARKA